MWKISDPKNSSQDRKQRRSLIDLLYARPMVSIALIALLLVMAVAWGYRILRLTTFTDELASDMAASHHAQQEMTFQVGAIPDLTDVMPRLPFAPVFPQRIENLQPAFTGADYCEIIGRIGVQIRLKNAAGADYSLFEVRLVSSDPDLDDSELIGEGVLVRLWQQDGLLMGLVGTK